MKVLLINNNHFFPPVTPIGLDYIADSLKHKFHEVFIHDCSVDDACLYETVESIEPEIIGITVRNIDHCHLLSLDSEQSPIEDVADMIHNMRKISNAVIILGGAGFSIMPVETLQRTNADFGIIGEGENSLTSLLENLKNPENVPNIVFRDAKTGNIRETEKKLFSIEHIPSYSRSLVNHAKYKQLIDSPECRSIFNIQTKRGCNKNCIYCAEPKVIGRKIRKRPVNKVIEELKALISYGINKKIFITDSEFNVCAEHAYRVCEAIIDNKLEIEWSCYMTPDDVDGDLIEVMKKAGCSNIVWSFESASESILETLGKEYSVSDILNVSALCDKNKLPYVSLLMFGAPGENIKTIDETYNNIIKTKPVIFGIVPGIRIYPKTELYNIAVREEEISDNDDLLKPVFYKKQYILETIYPYVKDKFSMKNAQYK